MATPSTTTNPPASLLTIPSELRNAIYFYVFCADSSSPASSFEINEPTNDNDLARALQLSHPPPTTPTNEPRENNLPLLLACRQIHAEAQTLALHHTPFHLSGATAEPERFSTLSAPLTTNHLIASLRHLTLHARISHLRALNERWNGLPFGQPSLHLHTLTLIPRKPECHAAPYAEVADLSQSHTLAYIVAETAKTLRQVRCLVVRNEGCFSPVVWRLVYRSLVYRVWRWAGPVAGLRFECSREGDEGDGEGREWLRVWIGDGECGDGDAGVGAREVGEEVVRLVGGKGEAGRIEDIPGL